MADELITVDDVERRPGRPHKYGPEIEEQALLEVALHGGSYRKASVALAERGIEIPEGTLSSWCRGRLRNRYHELCQQSSRVLEAEVARRATDLAIRIAEQEERAVKQIAATLPDTTAVEASLVLRNLSGSKAVQVDKAGAIRGRPTTVIDVRGADELAAALARLGVAEIVDADSYDELPDADVVD